ncbi:hypothetical protein HPC49_12805 [Pyxidicoccus fallax]|uniref:Uncharacterized protein n=1 Tax=Pyxidicoccus fallax TaxID=394095 RepID=A0A848L8V2_9BACT|nr:hypothetical protein [Pyxidicoccus fallax]NMO15420.1 hypothetical protein [Pyxidicoccus fallax]NPC79115.1 hypothetical protein [Pyxidicoccus fallax]
MANLKVKNESNAVVDIKLPDDSEKVTLTAGAEADVDEKFLRTDSFRDLMLAGKVSLVKTPLANLTAQQQALGESVSIWLLNQIGGPVLSRYQAMKSAREALARTRLRYNDQHKGTKELLTQAKAMGPAAQNLAGAAKHFINLTAEQSAVSKIQADITAKQNEDLAALGKSLETWYAERRVLEEKLKAAQAALEVAQAEHAARFEALVTALDQAATAMVAANPATDIGAEIPAHAAP